MLSIWSRKLKKTNELVSGLKSKCLKSTSIKLLNSSNQTTRTSTSSLSISNECSKLLLRRPWPLTVSRGRLTVFLRETQPLVRHKLLECQKMMIRLRRSLRLIKQSEMVPRAGNISQKLSFKISSLTYKKTNLNQVRTKKRSAKMNASNDLARSQHHTR